MVSSPILPEKGHETVWRQLKLQVVTFLHNIVPLLFDGTRVSGFGTVATNTGRPELRRELSADIDTLTHVVEIRNKFMIGNSRQ